MKTRPKKEPKFENTKDTALPFFHSVFKHQLRWDTKTKYNNKRKMGNTNIKRNTVPKLSSHATAINFKRIHAINDANAALNKIPNHCLLIVTHVDHVLVATGLIVVVAHRNGCRKAHNGKNGERLHDDELPPVVAKRIFIIVLAIRINVP